MIQFDDHIFHVGWFNHQLARCVFFFIWRYYHLLFCFNTSFGKADEDVALEDFCVGDFFIVRKRGIPEIIPWKTMLDIFIKGVNL